MTRKNMHSDQTAEKCDGVYLEIVIFHSKILDSIVQIGNQ